MSRHGTERAPAGGGWVPAERSLRRAAVRLRRQVAAAAAGAAAAAALAGFTLLAWLPAGRLVARGSWWPLAGVLLGVGLLGASFLWARRERRRLVLERLAAEAERAAGLRPGELRGALELGAPGEAESRALALLHRERVGAALGAPAPAAVFPTTAARSRRRLRRGAAAAIVGALFLASTLAVRPGAAPDTARALARGWRIAFPPPLSPLVLRPGDAVVVRGELLSVGVRASDRERVTLAWRVTGERTRRTELRPESDGWARGRLGPVETPGRYWVTAPDGATSDTFAVRPIDALLVAELRVRVLFPSHLDRPPEDHARPVPELLLPEGSRLEISGRANRALGRVGLRRAGGTATPPGGEPGSPEAASPGAELVELAVEGDRFRGRLDPGAGGVWLWELEASEQDPAGSLAPEPLRVEVVSDAVPSVTVVFPGRDTLLGTERALPLVVEVSDDIGIRRVELASWRAGSTPESARLERLASDRDARRAVLRPILDLHDLDLLPGDTVLYLVRALDGHPAHSPSVSDTFRVAIGSVAQLRAREAGAGEALATGVREAGRVAAELARAAREAGRRAAFEDPVPAAERGGEERIELGFEATQGGRTALERGEALSERLGELEEEVRRLADALSAAPLSDPQLAEELERLEVLYRELRETALGERLAELESALRTLERGALEEALAAMAEGASALRDRLERSLGLLERAVVAQEMDAVGAEAERLAERQRGMAAEAAPDAGWGERQSALADEAEHLAERLTALERRLAEAEALDASASTGEARAGVEDAWAAMRVAARSAGDAGPTSSESADSSGGEGAMESVAEGGIGSGAAREEAERAADSLDRAVESLSTAERAMDRESGELALRALRRAREEALALAREERELGRVLFGADAVEGPVWQARQAAVRRGLANLRRGLGEATRRTPLVDARIAPLVDGLAAGMDGMLSRMAESGARRRPFRDEVDAVSRGLGELALRLLRSEEAVRAARSSPGFEEASRRMAGLAQRQGGLARRTDGLASPGLPGAARRGELRRLAEEQAAIGRRLRELQDEELLGRPGRMAEEAEALGRRIAAGVTDPETVARQRRLFRRMLDAGRSLEDDRELDPTRRESRTADELRADLPPTDPSLYAGPRFPHPSEALLRDLPAAYRRLVFEYFDRLNGLPRSAPSGEGGRP